MKQSESAKIVALLMAALPKAKVGENTSAAYEALLADLGAEECMQAVRALIATWDNPYALPTIGQIRKAVTGVGVQGRTGELAWGDVLDAVHKVGVYGSPKFDDGLTEIALAAVGWRTVCNSTDRNVGFLQNSFIKAYQAAKDRVVNGGSVARLEEHHRHKLAGIHEQRVADSRGQLTGIRDAIAKAAK